MTNDPSGSAPEGATTTGDAPARGTSGTATAGNTVRNAAGGTSGNQYDEALNRKCTDITERFRGGEISKTNATLLLQQAIPYNADDEATFEQALESYTRVLDNFERIRNQTRPTGRRDGSPSQSPDHGEDDEEPDAPGGAAKRGRSPTE